MAKNAKYLQYTKSRNKSQLKANRFQFFSEKNVMELLLSDPVIDFDNKECNTVIDADNEAEITEYRILDLQQIKNDKLRMEAKLLALENKLQKHEKHLSDVVELEEQEVS